MDLALALQQGSLKAPLVVFAGGLLTALTPCVYPLIPVTVGIFGARAARRRAEAALLSGTYVLGIALMYSALGLAAAATGRVFGQFMSNPYVVGAIALAFAAFAASMFGAFELALPSALQQRLAAAGGRGYAGALAMGLVAGLIAAPCTGPVLAGVLAFVATTGSFALGFFLLFVFALGMGLPFFLIGTFAVSLPKSGPWMEHVKSALGIVLLVAALYFLQSAFPVLRPPPGAGRLLLVGGAATLLLGLALGAVHASFHAGAAQRARKAVGVTLATAGLFALVGVSSAGDVVPAAAGAGGAAPDWVRSEPAGLARARAEGKPALIDFTADWCAACKELEHKTYPDPAFRAEARRFVLIQIDATDASDENDRLTARYGVAGLPAVVFVDSRGNILPTPRVQGFVAAAELVAEMRKVR